MFMKDKKKIIFIVTIILGLLFIAGLFVIVKNKMEVVQITAPGQFELVQDADFEINETVMNTSLIVTKETLLPEEQDWELITEVAPLDTSEIAEHSYVFKIKLKSTGSIIEVPTSYTVSDTKSPEIFIKEETLILNIGSSKEDILKNIDKIEDNSGEFLDEDVSIEGEYDLNKEGEYILKYIVQDFSKNKAEKSFTLIIKKLNNSQASQNIINSSQDIQNKNENKNTGTSNKQNTQNGSAYNNPDSKEYQERLEKAKAIYNKYQNMYAGKFTKTRENFSPEQYVTITTFSTPVKFHYEWIISANTWSFVDDSGYISTYSSECQKLYPAPNRQGKEESYEENGITYYTGEKTQQYQLYGYHVIYDDGWAHFD